MITKFTKEDILSSKRWRRAYDVLKVILEDGKEYTEKEVKRALEAFEKMEVK